MTVHRTMSVAPLVFLVHDLEEIMQVGRMNAVGRDLRERLPEPIRRPMSRLRYTPGLMGAVVAPLLVAQVGLTLWRRRSPRAKRFLAFILAVRLLNGFTHMGESLALRRYVPGVATAPAVMISAGLALRSLKRGAPRQTA